MKTEYKYINFKIIEEKPKTKVWGCYNNKSDFLLGEIKWHGAWRQYCFFPSAGTVFNNGCLVNIINFINQLKLGGEEETIK